MSSLKEARYGYVRQIGALPPKFIKESLWARNYINHLMLEQPKFIEVDGKPQEAGYHTEKEATELLLKEKICLGKKGEEYMLSGVEQGDIDIIAERVIKHIESDAIKVIFGKLTERARWAIQFAVVMEITELYKLPYFKYEDLLSVMNLSWVLNEAQERIYDYIAKKQGFTE